MGVYILVASLSLGLVLGLRSLVVYDDKLSKPPNEDFTDSTFKSSNKNITLEKASDKRNMALRKIRKKSPKKNITLKKASNKHKGILHETRKKPSKTHQKGLENVMRNQSPFKKQQHNRHI